MEFRAASGAVRVLRVLVTAVLLLTALLLWMLLPMLGILPLAILPFAWWCCARFARSVYVSLNVKAVCVRYGVFWQREIFVPTKSLRTFEVWTPPLHRLYGCRTVVLRFAGGAALLPLLSVATVGRLAAQLELPEENDDGTAPPF